MLKPALLAALAVAASSSMAATTVDVSFTDASVPFYSGSFVATDTNDDGIIELDEVTSFTTALGLSSLSDFGDYDIADNTWTPTTVGDYYYYATSGTHTLALTAGDAVTTVPTVSAVPEPASASMMALGILGAFGWRARNRRRAAPGAAA